jgi:hypothetical protein
MKRIRKEVVWPTRSTIPSSLWRDWRKPRKTSFGVVCVPAKIRKEHHTKTCLERYRYTNLLGLKCVLLIPSISFPSIQSILTIIDERYTSFFPVTSPPLGPGVLPYSLWCFISHPTLQSPCLSLFLMLRHRGNWQICLFMRLPNRGSRRQYNITQWTIV